MNRSALIKYVNSVVGDRFVWGVLDCTLFPSYCLDALLGLDEAEGHAGKWRDVRTAFKYSKKNKLTLESWLIGHGCKSVAPNFQQTGDFLMIETINSESLPWLSAGVCLGRHTAICTENGIELFMTSTVKYSYILGVR